MAEKKEKINIAFFQRKPRPTFNFSIENIFQNLRVALQTKIVAQVKYCSFYNDGIIKKILNIIEAAFRQNKKAITHITGEVHYLNLLMSKKNILLTIHDCRFMERKTGIKKKIMNWLYLKAPVKKANYITAVSENTKQEIIYYTNCNPDKITVIPVSVDSIFKPAPKNFNKSCPVILQIGTAANKNIERLAEALRDVDCSLVIIGGLSAIQLIKLSEYNINYSVKSNLSQEELHREYINCDMIAFVSTYEGFGMPIVEANCIERSIITSSVSSMPEIAADAACIVNPFDVNDITKGIRKIIDDDFYRNQLIENGRKNRQRFNIEITANAYFNLYKKMMLN